MFTYRSVADTLFLDPGFLHHLLVATSMVALGDLGTHHVMTRRVRANRQHSLDAFTQYLADEHDLSVVQLNGVADHTRIGGDAAVYALDEDGNQFEIWTNAARVGQAGDTTTDIWIHKRPTRWDPQTLEVLGDDRTRGTIRREVVARTR